MSDLDKWIPVGDVKTYSPKHGESTHVMQTCFDEYSVGGIGVASVKFKFEDGFETRWFHPTEDCLFGEVNDE